MQISHSRYFLTRVMLIFILSLNFVYAGRPIATEDIGVAGKGIFELEISWDRFQWGGSVHDDLYSIVVNYGLTDRLQIGTELPYLSLQSPNFSIMHGISDIIFSAKYLMINESRKYPGLAVLGAIKTNSGNAPKGLGSGNLDYGLVLSTTKSINRLAIHAMAGYFVTETLDDFISYGIGIEFLVSSRLNLAAEIIGDSFVELPVSDPVMGLIGFSYAFSNTFVVDSGVRIGLTETAPNLNLTIGISTAFH